MKQALFISSIVPGGCHGTDRIPRLNPIPEARENLVRFRDEYVGNHDARLRHSILNRTRVVGFTQSETSVLAQGGSSRRRRDY